MHGTPEAPTCEDAQLVNPITGIEKKCSKCKKIKDMSLFSLAKNKDGRRSNCKKCSAKYTKEHYDPQRQKEYRIKNKDRAKIISKKWRENNKEKILAKWEEYKTKNHETIKAKGREYYYNNREKYRLYVKNKKVNHRHKWASVTIATHRKSGYIVNMTPLSLLNKIKDITHCPFCNVELSFGNNKKMRANSPTLDRINNGKILNLDNTRVLCAFCNKVKGDKTLEDLFLYLNKLINSEIFNPFRDKT